MQLQKRFLQTTRKKVAYLRKGDPSADKFVLIHGNASSCVFFAPLMDRLAEDFDVIAPDLSGFGDSEAVPCNGETGLADWAEDIDAFLSALGAERFHLLGWSLGGGVVMKYLLLHPEKVKTLLLFNPMSPYGFGGTRGEDGQMYDENGWGCAGGFANPTFLQHLAAGDRSSDPASPRTALKGLFKNGWPLDKEWEDLFVDEFIKIHQGPDYYPGDYIPASAFPYVLPGKRGFNNALAPQYANVTAIVDLPNKPPILWLRGDSDTLVSDNSYADMAVLGMMGALPGYPGAQIFPPQPMVSQTRAVLKRYKANGGSYHEFVFANCGHGCLLEKPEAFYRIVAENLK